MCVCVQPPVLIPQMASPAAFLMEEIMMESELVDLSACPMVWDNWGDMEAGQGNDPLCQSTMCSLQNGMYSYSAPEWDPTSSMSYSHATEDECLEAECGAIRDTTTNPSCAPTARQYPSLVLPSSCNVAGYAAEPSTGCAMSYDVSWLVSPPPLPFTTIALEIFRANVPLLCVPSSTANR